MKKEKAASAMQGVAIRKEAQVRSTIRSEREEGSHEKGAMSAPLRGFSYEVSEKKQQAAMEFVVRILPSGP